MLTSMKQYNELVEEYKIKVLSYARIVILLVSPPSHILRNLGNFFFNFVFFLTPSYLPPISTILFRYGLFYLWFIFTLLAKCFEDSYFCVAQIAIHSFF